MYTLGRSSREVADGDLERRLPKLLGECVEGFRGTKELYIPPKTRPEDGGWEVFSIESKAPRDSADGLADSYPQREDLRERVSTPVRFATEHAP